MIFKRNQEIFRNFNNIMFGQFNSQNEEHIINRYLKTLYIK